MVLHAFWGSRKRGINIWLKEAVKQFFEPASWSYILFWHVTLSEVSFSLWMHLGHPYLTPRSRCVACEQLSEARLKRRLSTYPAPAQGFIEPRSWEIWTNQICVNMLLSLPGLMLTPASLNAFPFLFQSNFLSIIILVKELLSTQNPGRLQKLLRNILANCEDLGATSSSRTHLFMFSVKGGFSSSASLIMIL